MAVKHCFSRRIRVRTALLASSMLTMAALPAAAQDATWLANPGSGDFYDASNWNPASVPTGTATFGTSTTTALTLGTAGSIGGWTFNTGASNYTFNITSAQDFTGAGITINGGSASIINDSFLSFYGASAGSATITNNVLLQFQNTSTAGSAIITNSGGMEFFGTGTAGGATIDNNSNLYFYDTSTAGGSAITNDGTLRFNGIATAGTASITNSAGRTTEFRGNSTAGNAQLINNGAGAVFDFSVTTGPNGDNKLSAGSIAGNGTVNLGANELTVGGNNLSTTVSGVISGSGSLVKTGTGTMTLTGANTYTGATTVSAGVLDIQGSLASSTITNNASLSYSSNATAGSAAITNNFFLDFWNTATAGSATIANNYVVNFNGASTAGGASIVNDAYVYFKQTSTAGNAVITNNSLGTIEFRNSSTAGSAAIANAGVVDFSGSTGPNNDHKISAGSIAGSGTFNLGANELTVGSNNQSTVVSGVISDGGAFGGTGGALVKTGSGTLTLSGANTYTGGTTISDGTLQIGNGGTGGSITGNIVNNTALIYNRSNAVTYAGVISGTGTLQKLGGGTLTLTGANTYTGDTTISAGTLQIGNGGTTGSVIGNIINNSALIYNRSNAVTYAGVISGTGTLDKISVGTLTLTGANTYTGDTTISAGTLQIGNGGTTGSVIGNIFNNSALIYNRSNAVTYSGVISGTGTLEKISIGTLTLTGANTYTGDTTISTGTLQVGNGGTTGSVIGNIVNNSALIYNRSNAVTYSGVISGTGTLQKLGGGTLALTGANTYTGDTTISAGTLQLGDAGGVGSVLGAVGVGSGTTFDVVNADTSGITSIANSGNAYFRNSTSAGGATITNNYLLIFYDASTAGGATITNNNSMSFFNNSTAGGADITNNYSLTFWGNSTVGSATILNNYALTFRDTTSAGSATIINDSGGLFGFYGNSSAGSADITNNGSMWFNNGSNAGSAWIFNNGTLAFYDATTADGATIENGNGRTTEFRGNSTAGNAHLLNNGPSAAFDFSASTGPNGDNKLSAGSIAGGGTFNLGANELTVGGNNRSTTVSGVISGSGSLVKTGTGTMTLSGTNTYQGGTTVTGGLINFANDANLGTGNITLNGGGLQWAIGSNTDISSRLNAIGVNGATFDTNFMFVNFATGLTGTGSVTKAGAGSLNLAGVNTYTGATIVDEGALNILGSIVSPSIINNATLSFFYGSSAGNAIVQNNAVAGGGRIYFYDSTSAGGASITNDQLIYFYSGSTAGTATITNNRDLTFYDNSTAGNATITNNAAGTITLNDSATLGSATITNNGSITFYSNTTAGSAVITNNGDILFDGNSTADNAQLINNAPGAVVNFFTPGPSSDGRISAGSLAGGGRFDLNDTELTVGGNNRSTIVAGTLTGTGIATGVSLIKTGTGTLTLSGINTYTGGTTVDGGGLVVNGSIAASSSLTMNSGTRLGGTGQLPTTVINSGATLAPGNSIGTLSVQGNLTFNNGSSYAVEISSTAADRTDVTGTAALTGATVDAVTLPGSFRGRTYTILNATGGLGGTQFAGLNVSGSSIAPGARNPHLTYDANNAYLVLDAGLLQLPAGTSGNQAGVAGAINRYVESGGAPPAAFDTLLNMGGAQQANALDQLSGQASGGAAGAGSQMTTSFMNTMLNPFSGESGTGGSALGYARGFGAGEDAKATVAYAAVTPKDRRANGASFEQRWSLWGSAFGGTSRTGGDAAAGSADTSARTYGVAGGADYRPAPDLLVGFALAGGGTSWSLSQGLGSGQADVFQIGAYASKTLGAAYVSGALTYAWHGATTDRTVTVGGTERLEGRFNAHSYGGRLEAGYRFAMPWVGVTPYAALQAQSFVTPSYSETAISGTGAFALTYNARTSQSLRTELGAWFDKSFALHSGDALTLRGRAAWAHDKASGNGIDAAFQTLPGSSFTVYGAEAPENAALLSLGGEWRMANRVTLGARFDGEFSRRARSYAGTGSLRYAW